MADQIFPVNCGFFDAVNNDRLYTANQMNLPYKRVIGNGVFATPAGTPSTDLQVSAPGGGMSITVQPGEGIFAYKWYNNPAALSITVPPNTGTLQRIDSVIVQVDERVSGRVGNIVYRPGTPGNPPQPPEINTTDGVTEYRLANVSVPAGATAIDASMVNDLRGSVHCPWVTSLIQQVDTSTLFDQFNAAYTNQYKAYTLDFEQYKAQQREAWEEFVKTLTDQITVSTNIITYKSSCTITGPTTLVPINIPSFDPATDLLQVYINGLFANPGEKYVIVSSDEILLTNPIDAGNLVYFFVFKSVIGGDIESTVSMMQRMDEEIRGFMADSGWQRLPLSGEVLPGSDSTAPAIRQIGNRVYLRGSVRNVTGTDTLLCVLPVEMRPANNHDYLSAALADPDITTPFGIRIEADTGKVIALAPTGPIAGYETISLATTFLSATGNPQSLIYDFKGTVPNYAALPTSGQQAGDVYKILSADTAHNIPAGGKVMWDGLEWEIVATGGSSEPPYQEFTDGGWRWRIWNDGQLEAWYSAHNVELRVANQKGQVFESDKTTIAFPAGLIFADYDAVQVQFNVSASLFGAWSNVYSVAAEGIQYSAFSATDRGRQTCYRVSAYLSGETGV